MAVYLELAASMGDVKGQVTEENHVDWIECSSFSAGMNRNVESRIGAGESRTVSKPMVQDITLSKGTDKASIAIFKSSLAGTSGVCKIHMTQSFGNSTRTYLEYTLTNTIISSHSTSAGEDGMCYETLSLNFTKIEVRHTPHDPEGNPGGAQTGEYDLATGVVG